MTLRQSGPIIRGRAQGGFCAWRPGASILVGSASCFSERVSALTSKKAVPPLQKKGLGKTDAADAEAIAEAVTRPTMRFMAMKTKAQQALLMLHKTRDLLVRHRTGLINALRGHLGEFGIVAPQDAAGVRTPLHALLAAQVDLPELATSTLRALAAQLEALGSEIEALSIASLPGIGPMTSRRLVTIPGIGPITASAIAASAADPSLFRCGRQFAAWLGLTPRAQSSGGKER